MYSLLRNFQLEFHYDRSVCYVKLLGYWRAESAIIQHIHVQWLDYCNMSIKLVQ